MSDVFSIHSTSSSANLVSLTNLTYHCTRRLIVPTVYMPYPAAAVSQVPIWLTKLTYLLDHPWARCVSRADKVCRETPFLKNYGYDQSKELLVHELSKTAGI